MGRPTLPSITKINEVWDILTDPSKYQAYITELRAVHQDVKDALGDLQTKDQADAYLAKAYDANAQAQSTLADANTKSQKMVDDANVYGAAVHAEADARLAKTKAMQVDIETQRQQLLHDQASFEAYRNGTEVTLKNHEEDLVNREANLAKLKQEVETRKAKFEAALK